MYSGWLCDFGDTSGVTVFSTPTDYMAPLRGDSIRSRDIDAQTNVL